MNDGKGSTGTQAVARAFSILRVFDDGTPEWGLADVSRTLGLTKTTTFRLLSALEREGMVARSGRSGGYRLGHRAIELGAIAQRSNSLHRAAHEELEYLARTTGETSSLEILIGADILILDEVQGRHKLSPAPSIGARWPAHAASTGKVLLAAAREHAESGQGTERPGRLLRLTPQTITNRAALAAELNRVAKRGYAVAREELETGYVAVGAPVRNQDGHTVAAMSVGGPSTRFQPDRIHQFARVIREAADRVSRRLGADGARPRRTTS